MSVTGGKALEVLTRNVPRHPQIFSEHVADFDDLEYWELAADTDVTLTVARVALRRAWFDRSIFARADWSVPGRATGDYSTGLTHGENDGNFPLLPTAFFMALTQEDDRK